VTSWPVSVKAVLFDDQGRVLLARNERAEWELPGGRLEPGESLEECVCREVAEETGLSCTVSAALPPFVFEVIQGRHVVIIPFSCRVHRWGALVRSEEHTDLQLFSLSELRSIPLPVPYVTAIEGAAARLGRPGSAP
jgi:8-oxo-dGTP pyrophosphatase MutT (NUDIX family)